MKSSFIKVFSAVACVFAFGCTEGMNEQGQSAKSPTRQPAELLARQRLEKRDQPSAKWQAEWRQQQAERDYERKFAELNYDCLQALDYGVKSLEYQGAKRAFDNFLETVPNPGKCE